MTGTATQTYNAFAHDATGHPGPDPITGDDGAYAPDGITIEDATGREVAGRNLDWPSGKFAPEFADETLARMGFRRTGPWEWLGWDWRASLVAAKDPDPEYDAQLAKVYEYLRKVGAAYADQIRDATEVPPATLVLAAARLDLSNLYGEYSLPVQTSFDSPEDDD